MKALIAGAAGQLGTELCRTAPDGVSIVARPRGQLDITDFASVARAMNEAQPDIVINAAAYTAVDRAEDEREAAFAINGTGAGNLARAAAACGARFIHVSTDFVFDGELSCGYAPGAKPNPLSAYGASKLQGEELIRADVPSALILRTSWVYSVHGKNFVHTMLRLMAERDSIGVVADQIGAPTWAQGLARVIWQAADADVSGTHHWSDAGAGSWYDFAVAIREEALALGLLTRAAEVRPIATSDYVTRAQRPRFSVLDSSSLRGALGIEATHWRVNLRTMLQELKAQIVCDDSLLPAVQAS